VIKIARTGHAGPVRSLKPSGDGSIPDTSEACHRVLADKYGLDAPRLIASDLDGEHAGQVATLETLLTGSSAPGSVG
jgi:hypothetical protein